MSELPTGIRLGQYPDGSEELAFSVYHSADFERWSRALLQGHRLGKFHGIRHLKISFDDSPYRARIHHPMGFFLAELQQALPNIEGIHLENTGTFPIRLLTSLVRITNTLKYIRLEAIILDGNLVDMQELADALQDQTALQSFQLQDASFSHGAFGRSVNLYPIICALSLLPTLERVHIRAFPAQAQNGSATVGRLGTLASTLSQGLGCVTNLSQLKLENFDLKNDHLILLAKGLSSNPSIPLRQVELSSFTPKTMESPTIVALNNAITATYNHSSNHHSGELKLFRLGMIHEQEALLYGLATGALMSLACTLQELDIGSGDHQEDDDNGTMMRDRTTKAVVDMLAHHNTTLQWIHFPGHYSDSMWMPTIEFYLKLNRSGIRNQLLHLVENKESSHARKWIQVLTDISQDLDLVFFWIQANPWPF